MTEYEVVWGNQDLGCTLREGGPGGCPIVGRITRRDAVAATSGVRSGHLLVAVNGRETSRIGYDSTVDLLKNLPRPGVLRFLAPAGDAPPGKAVPRDEYTVVWEEGKLGIVFTPGGQEVLNLPCVKQLTGHGRSGSIARVKLGDLLISVNQNQASRLGYQGSIDLLKVVGKPCILRFKVQKSLRSASAVTGRIVPENSIIPPRFSAPPTVQRGGKYGGSSAREGEEYDVVWREGNLGLTLKPNISNIPFISRKSGNGDGAEGFELAHEGDELIAVNGIRPSRDFYQTMAMVKSAKQSGKPVVLRFKAGVGASERQGSDSYPRSSRGSGSSEDWKGSSTSTGALPLPSSGAVVAGGPQSSIAKRFAAGVVPDARLPPPPPVIPLPPPGMNPEVYEYFLHQQREAEKRLAQYDEELRRAAQERERLAKLLQEKQRQVAEAEDDYGKQVLDTAKNILSSPSRMSMLSPGIPPQASTPLSPASLSNYGSPSVSSPKRKGSVPKTRDPKKKALINELHAILGLPKLGQKKKCSQCGKEETEEEPLEQDESDMRWYCTKCLDEYYAEQRELEEQWRKEQEELARKQREEYEAALAQEEQEEAQEAEEEVLREQKQKEVEDLQKKHLLAKIAAENAAMQRRIEQEEEALSRVTSAAGKIHENQSELTDEQILQLSSAIEKAEEEEFSEVSEDEVDSEAEGEGGEGEQDDSVWL